MYQQDKKAQYNNCEVLNIKGLSWMLKGNSVGTTTNSSHVSNMNEHFKIFKLKDEKKKWKKKTNKKFEGVKVKIEQILKNQVSQIQPFDQNYLKLLKPEYVPHLKIIIKNEEDQKQNLKAKQLQQQIMMEIKQKYKINELKTKEEMNDEIMKLIQSYQTLKNSCKKIQKIKNIGRIYQKKRQLFQQTINQYFKEEEKETLKKIQKFKKFNIEDFQRKLIQTNIQKQKSQLSHQSFQKQIE